jgi:hypothetical protein
MHPPPVDAPTACQYTHPPVNTPTLPYRYTGARRLLSFLWAMVLRMTWQAAWTPTSLKEGRGKKWQWPGDDASSRWVSDDVASSH